MENQAALSFPQYRRYLNGKSYFCFESPNAFEEIRAFGSRWLSEKFEVKILPDRNLVHDLLYQYEGIAEVVSAEDFAAKKALVNG